MSIQTRAPVSAKVAFSAHGASASLQGFCAPKRAKKKDMRVIRQANGVRVAFILPCFFTAIFPHLSKGPPLRLGRFRIKFWVELLFYLGRGQSPAFVRILSLLFSIACPSSFCSCRFPSSGARLCDLYRAPRPRLDSPGLCAPDTHHRERGGVGFALSGFPVWSGAALRPTCPLFCERRSGVLDIPPGSRFSQTLLPSRRNSFGSWRWRSGGFKARLPRPFVSLYRYRRGRLRRSRLRPQ